MADPIRIRARHRGGLTEVMVLMPHAMETGLRQEPAGSFVPAHYITEVLVALVGAAGQRTVLEARMSNAVSRDPLLSFRFRGGQPGERLRVTWLDNLGLRRSDDVAIV